MAIKVRFFASLREQLGYAEYELAPQEGLTVAQVWIQSAAGSAWPANIISAVNMEYRDQASPVADGDEVAFFPPVTGG